MQLFNWLGANWVKVSLTLATLIYLPFAYVLIKDSGACAPPIAGEPAYWEFYYRYLVCREVNVIGDTFAGFFAPLAFIWLAGAVYIQSQELAAQRRELDETQEVMRAQLEVARQQVEETKASTDLFREQTEILKKEQHQREQKQADEEFEEKLESAFKLFREVERLYLIHLLSSNEKSAVQLLSLDECTIFNLEKKPMNTLEGVLDAFLDGIRKTMNYVETTPIKDGYRWAWSNDHGAKLISECLEHLCKNQKKLSDAYEWRKKRLGIDEAYWRYYELRTFISRKNIVVSMMENPHPNSGSSSL
ncbi:hypothetical protein D3C87_1023750 [compost metagenome]